MKQIVAEGGPVIKAATTFDGRREKGKTTGGTLRRTLVFVMEGGRRHTLRQRLESRKAGEAGHVRIVTSINLASPQINNEQDEQSSGINK